MATHVVELTLRAEINAPHPGAANLVLKHETELLNNICDALKRQGYQRPEVTLKSWEKT